jgi:dTDP-4-dehydrorhamnose reductase
MTRVLVLGASGMLGHKFFQRASKAFDVTGTVRRWDASWDGLEILDRSRIAEVEATDFDEVRRVVTDTDPEWIVNCIGIVKQREEARDETLTTRINVELPLFLARLSARRNARLIHISTDCVFSGRQGHYREADSPDATDLYGISKLRSEAAASAALVLRTSLIGREITGGYSLVEWFLRKAGPRAGGFTRAVFSGLTTIAAAEEMIRLIRVGTLSRGLYHLAADPIDKHSLLVLLRDAFGRSTEIVADQSLVIDRSLDGSLYRSTTGFAPTPWEAMVAELAADPTPYDRLTLEN